MIDAAGPRAGAEDVTEQSVVRKAAWRLMPLIMVCYMFAFFDRIDTSFAKFQLQSDLGFSSVAYGLGASLFVVGYVLFEVPSNLMLYRVGARRWIARILIFWGIATSLMVFITTEWQFYALRFLIGAMEAGFAPGILYYLTLWFPASFRSRVTSFMFVALAFSDLVAAPVAGLILDGLNGVQGLAGWQWLFLTGGLPCLRLGGLPLFWTLPPKLVTGAGAAGGIALIDTPGQAGGIVSPTAIGWVKDLTGSTTPATYGIAVLCLVTVALALFAMPESLRRHDRTS